MSTNNTYLFLILLLALNVCGVSHAQDLTPTAPPQDQPVLIHGGTVHTMAGETYAPGYVLFDAGLIVEVGEGALGQPVPEGTRQIDASGLHIYPGFIAGPSTLGLQEIEAVRATDDYNEAGSLTPEVYAAVAVNPDSTLIPVARSGGVLTFIASPRGGRVPGRASVMCCEGWTWEDMTLMQDAGLMMTWPNMRPIRAWWMDQSDAEQRKERDEAIDEIDALFDAAGAYRDARAADPGEPTDLRLEAMLRVLPSAGADQRPVIIQAHDVDQIAASVSWAVERGLRPIIHGGRDAPLAASLLTEHEVPVILAGTFRFPKRGDSPYDDAFTLPARCEAAGLDWCLAYGSDPSEQRNLPFTAALAVAHGLEVERALEAITIDMARTIGVGDQLGSLEAGKRATFIVTTGNPLEVRSAILTAFVDGRNIDLTNKQTKLYELYRERYIQLGLIPLQPAEE